MAPENQNPCDSSNTAPPPPPRNSIYLPFIKHRVKIAVTVAISVFIVVAFTVVLVVVVLIILRPDPPEVYVESADLTTFDLTSSSTLVHNLTTKISFRNPNKKSSLFYHWLEANGYYNGQWFERKQLPVFCQGHDIVMKVRAELAGETAVGLGASGVGLFYRQKREGAFDVELCVYGGMDFHSGSKRYTNLEFEAKCLLPALPLGGDGDFKRTKCNVGY